MVANAAHFSTERRQSLGRDSNPRPAAYKAAALPLSYPGVLAGQLINISASQLSAHVRTVDPDRKFILTGSFPISASKTPGKSAGNRAFADWLKADLLQAAC